MRGRGGVVDFVVGKAKPSAKSSLQEQPTSQPGTLASGVGASWRTWVHGGYDAEGGVRHHHLGPRAALLSQRQAAPRLQHAAQTNEWFDADSE